MNAESPHCPYCQSHSALSFQHREERMTACAPCGAWFVWPPPTPGEVLAHYGANSEGMPGQLREWRAETSQNGWYEHLARRMARRKLPAEVRSVVDVGAGALELTRRLAEEFRDARVEAWDLFASGVPQQDSERISARRVDLNRLDVAAIDGAQFDVVACVAVIEHVLDPLALLRLICSITAPGGVAYVVGPEVRSLAHRLLGKRWPYYCPDEHLTLPSLTSIERAMAVVGEGSYAVRRVNVHYSLKYLLRFLRLPLPLPRAADVLLPLPTGAFELVIKG